MAENSSNQQITNISSVQIHRTEHIKDYTPGTEWASYRPVEKFFGPENSFFTVATSYGNEWNAGEQIIIESHRRDGEINWTKLISDRPYYVVNSAATNTSGDIFISGSRSLEGDFPKTNEVFGENTVEHFVAKINNEGAHEWITRFDSENLEMNSTNWTSGDIELTANGDILTFIEKANQSNTLAKLNSEGNIVWTKRLAEYDITSGEFIDSDSEGDIYIGGNKSVDGNYANNIVKINDSGEEIWRTTVGGSRTDYMQSMLYTNNNLYISGITDSSDFAENKDDNLWQNYVAKIDNSGSLDWSIPIQSNSVSQESLKPLDDQGIAFVGIKNNHLVDGFLDPWSWKTYDTLFVARISESGDHDLYEFSPNPELSFMSLAPMNTPLTCQVTTLH